MDPLLAVVIVLLIVAVVGGLTVHPLLFALLLVALVLLATNRGRYWPR